MKIASKISKCVEEVRGFAKVMILMAVVCAPVTLLYGQGVVEELEAIERAYGQLKGLSGETEMRLHVLLPDGSKGGLLEEMKGEMVWSPGLRHEKLDGVERFAGDGRLVMVDHTEKVVMVQPLDAAQLEGPLPAFGQPVGELMKSVQRSELLAAVEGSRGIRLHYGGGLYSEVTI